MIWADGISGGQKHGSRSQGALLQIPTCSQPSPSQQQEFRAAYAEVVETIPTLGEPVETLAPLILGDQGEKARQHHLWACVLKLLAEHHGFWLTTATAPPPDCVQIHCGGLGGGALGGPDAPTFDPVSYTHLTLPTKLEV